MNVLAESFLRQQIEKSELKNRQIEKALEKDQQFLSLPQILADILDSLLGRRS